MRIWQLLVGIFFLAILMTVARDASGRVAIVVFFMGLGEFVIGLASVMTLFRTFGAIGDARNLRSYAEAVILTALVLVVASVTMNSLLWVGINLVQRVVP